MKILKNVIILDSRTSNIRQQINKLDKNILEMLQCGVISHNGSSSNEKKLHKLYQRRVHFHNLLGILNTKKERLLLKST